MIRSDAAAGLIDGWFDAARRRGGRVVFPEGEDPRVVEAACRLRAAGVCEVHVIGRRAEIEPLATTACGGLPDDVIVHEPDAIAAEGSLPALVREVLLARGMDVDRAAARATEPVSPGAAMARRGDVDACVAGAATPSVAVLRAVLRAALQIVGVAGRA
ncbi:MAG TPA: phosphate acyltransferase [Candidatus Limnocylindrales bacterium]